MRTPHWIALGSVLCACVATATGQIVAEPASGSPGPAAETVLSSAVFDIAPQTRVRLAGNATIGGWSSASQQVSGTLLPGITHAHVAAVYDQIRQAVASGDKKGSLPAPPAVTAPRVNLVVPVRSLRSGDARMERDMRKALRAEDHPTITYTLEAIDAGSWYLADGGREPVIHLATRGSLLLAGQTQPIDMAVRVERLGSGRFRLLGLKTLTMSAFGIKPPTALFGLIRAEDTVVVSFDVVVQPGAEVMPVNNRSEGRAFSDAR